MLLQLYLTSSQVINPVLLVSPVLLSVKGGSLESESGSSEGKGVSVTTEGVSGTMKARSGGEWYSSWVSVEPSDGICLITFRHEISSLSREAFNCLRTRTIASLIAVSTWEHAKDSISRDRSLD